METIGHQIVAVLVAFSALVTVSLGAQSKMASQQLPAASPTPFPVCIDDSDCIKLGKGDKFACFQVHFPTYLSFLGNVKCLRNIMNHHNYSV